MRPGLGVLSVKSMCQTLFRFLSRPRSAPTSFPTSHFPLYPLVRVCRLHFLLLLEIPFFGTSYKNSAHPLGSNSDMSLGSYCVLHAANAFLLSVPVLCSELQKGVFDKLLKVKDYE